MLTLARAVVILLVARAAGFLGMLTGLGRMEVVFQQLVGGPNTVYQIVSAYEWCLEDSSSTAGTCALKST